VGRITAHLDHRWDEFQGGKDGMFGFIEAIDDVAVFRALFAKAREWLAKRGRERLLGPMDFTTNDECGLLVEGFDDPPIILQPWHPPYYASRIEECGLGKAMDLYMWQLYLGKLKQGDQFTPMIHAAARISRVEHGVVVRQMRRRDIDAEVARFMDVYNAAWGRNWGFLPITEEEVRFQAKLLKPILDENWAMIAEREGEVVGAALTLPDYNQVLAKLGGRLLPLGWLKFLRERKNIDRIRVFALGVKPEYQHYGVAAALYERHLVAAATTPQHGGEMGWILETNKPMNRAMEGMGGKLVKRYRLYEQREQQGAQGEDAPREAPVAAPERERARHDDGRHVAQQQLRAAHAARRDEGREERAAEPRREQRLLALVPGERGEQHARGRGDDQRDRLGHDLQVRPRPPRDDVHQREREPDEHVAVLLGAARAEPPAERADPDGREGAERDALRGADLDVLHGPAQEDADAHDDGEHGEADGAVAADELLEVELLGARTTTRLRGGRRGRWRHELTLGPRRGRHDDGRSRCTHVLAHIDTRAAHLGTQLGDVVRELPHEPLECLESSELVGHGRNLRRGPGSGEWPGPWSGYANRRGMCRPADLGG
jgi:hypothetical protein